jgi:hypothetical protein
MNCPLMNIFIPSADSLHCSPTHTATAPALISQRAIGSTSIMTVFNSSVALYSLHIVCYVSWVYQCILLYRCTYILDVTILVCASLRTLRAKAIYVAEDSGLFGYDTVSLGRQCWVGLCMPWTLDGRSWADTG